MKGEDIKKEIPIENVRLRELMNDKTGGNELEFSSLIGISQPRINRMYNPPFAKISFSILQAVKKRFNDVSLDYLVLGIGSLYEKNQKSSKNEEASSNLNNKIIELEKNNDYLKEKIDLLEKLNELKDKLLQKN